MSFYQRLLDETAAEREAFLAIPVLRAGVAGAIDREVYLAFLAQAYHHVRHTAPPLMACGARIPDRLEWLREAVAHYIEEEIGHDQWILDDIRNASGDPQAVRVDGPALATEVMVAYAYAYDAVLRRNPVGLFGMVLVLEGTSVNLATQAAGALRQALGLGGDCFRYLSSHGALDVSHMGFFETLMNRLEEPEDQQAVIHCARVMYRLYGDVFRSLPYRVEEAAA